MDHYALAALIVFIYAFGLVTVLKVGRTALSNASISSRVYLALIATFAVLAAIVIRIIWSQFGSTPTS